MDYILLIISLIGFWLLTPILSTFLGVVGPAIFFTGGFILSYYSEYAGIGALLGCLINLLVASGRIPKFGFFKNYNRKGIIASYSLFIAVSLALINHYFLHFTLKSNFIVFCITIGAIGSTFLYIFKNSKRNVHYSEEVENYRQSVSKYRIVQKYPKEGQWAVYLYFNNGKEDWNYAVPSSEHAKDPINNDLTYVFDSEKDAKDYAESFFINAMPIMDTVSEVG